MPQKAKSLYSERDSPFFRLRSKKKLAALLFCSLEKLKALSKADDLYHSFTKVKKGGGLRTISAPRTDLKAVQARIAELLQRIAPPDFLFAPVAGRSYVDNAAHHIGARSFRLLDIEDFFPSCTANRVIWLFRTRLECSDDVAAILRGLVTQDGCLPQGSPCSPILAYLSYVDMWEEIEKLVRRHNCKLSVYADDITVSGNVVPEALIWEIKCTLFKCGHRYSRQKERSLIDRPAEVTGAIVLGGRLALPNRQHKKLFELQQRINTPLTADDRDHLLRRLRGRNAQKRQIYNRPRRQG